MYVFRKNSFLQKSKQNKVIRNSKNILFYTKVYIADHYCKKLMMIFSEKFFFWFANLTSSPNFRTNLHTSTLFHPVFPLHPYVFFSRESSRMFVFLHNKLVFMLGAQIIQDNIFPRFTLFILLAFQHSQNFTISDSTQINISSLK